MVCGMVAWLVLELRDRAPRESREREESDVLSTHVGRPSTEQRLAKTRKRLAKSSTLSRPHAQNYSTAWRIRQHRTFQPLLSSDGETPDDEMMRAGAG